MFGSLFDDEKPAGVMTHVNSLNVSVPSPPLPRLACGFSGIENQGATCYLNSLLQTLLFTPEFREGLFKLLDCELGSLEEREKGGKVRIIPLQLQRLFARLLLVDQQAASTTELTDSFGWSNNEELQQHDVQELNRILFSAIESSLVGTSGSDLISKLYHGSTVSEIVCQICGKISEKEEDFLDLNVIVATFSSLKDSLNATFLQKETMKGKNQYRCSTCCNLVDAKKGLKIRCLPPILTFSLSRFSYDIAKGERYKETGKFMFPMEVDMSPYCDKVSTHDSIYELFSVVIHSGSSYGGHYHAYIRDVDCLGKWFTPEEEPLLIPSTSNNSFDSVQGPVPLISAILAQQPENCCAVDVLCREISKTTGLSWNKRFKGSHGAINKFLQQHSDTFEFNPVTNVVYLKDETINKENSLEDMSLDSSSSNPPSSSEINPSSPKETRKKNALKLNFFDKKKSTTKSTSLSPVYDQNWFGFNDARVSPIFMKDIEKQFSGKESAYMLFYRRKSLVRPEEAKGNPHYVIPKRFIEMAEQETADLINQRELYELALNNINLQVLLADNYIYDRGALLLKEGVTTALDITIDKRKSMPEAFEIIHKMCCEAELFPENVNFHLFTARELPAGLHLFEELDPTQAEMSLCDVGILEGTKVFASDGYQIDGKVIPIGGTFEPILLNISTNLGSVSGENGDVSRGFSKTMTIAELKIFLCNFYNLRLENVLFSKMEIQGEETGVIPLVGTQDECTLAEMAFTNGDTVLIENARFKREHMICEEEPKLQTLVIQNRCVLFHDGETERCEVYEFTVNSENTIGEVKATVIQKIGLEIEKHYLFRRFSDVPMKRIPVHDSTVVKLGNFIDSKYLTLEEGKPPTDEEITIMFSIAGLPPQPLLELNVDKKMNIQQCLNHMLLMAGLTGDAWHLQKTNWCGEPMELLFLESATLEDEGIQHGDFLLIAEGRVPPKGHMNFTIWLYPTYESLPTNEDLGHVNGILADYANLYKHIYSILEHECGLVKIGEVEISGDSTVTELKKYVLTIPFLSAVSLPNVRYLRLRLLDGNCPGKVLRGPAYTLKKLRLQSHQSLCVQLLPKEEELTQNDLLLNVCMRLPDSKSYGPISELAWDTTKSSHPKVFKQVLSDILSIPLHRLVIAKHFREKYHWLIIEDICSQKKSNRTRWGTKKANLRFSPYFFKDGDTIGVKDRLTDPDDLDDFNTQDDIKGQEGMRAAAEGKRQRRQIKMENGGGEWMLGGSDSENSKLTKKSEIGITIHVDDFR